MQNQTQQAYLQEAKAKLAKTQKSLTWDQFALLCGISPRAFKTYRMPEESKDYRTMPSLARNAVERVLEKY